MEEDAVRRQLLEDNAYFRRILDLIPAQFYFDVDAKRKLRGEESTEEGEETEMSSRQRKKKFKQLAADGKGQSKRKRSDPAHAGTVTSLQQQLIDAEQEEKTAKKSRKSKLDPLLLPASRDTENLKEKLEEKIKSLQAKRKSYNGPDCMEKKRLKRRESKLKMKMKQKSEKVVKQVKDHMANGGKSPGGKTPSKKPIYNKEGKIVFSKFDFTNSPSAEKKQSDALVGKNYKQLLDKVNKQKEKIQKLKETDETAAKAFQEKTQWKTVLQKAEGLKVKDNPELIKKALKRKDKLKERSKKKWEDRDKKVKDTMKAKQDKRRDNIQKKKKTRKDNKVQKARKKGRMLPGF